jgi:hypothetical protein
VIRYLPRCGGKSFCIRVYKNEKHIGNIRQTPTKWYYFRPVHEPRKAGEYGSIGEMKAWCEKNL